MWHPTFRSQPANGPAPHHGMLHQWSERIKMEIFSHPATRCSVCHADLTPDEFTDGMCKDQSACCLRRYSQRCF